MEKIKKKYIIDENNRRVAVQIDIATYNKIEEILENYGLFRLMKENEKEETFDLINAKNFYQKLDKSS